MLNKFAHELKKAREKADITLQNLSARSRLDIKFLQSMEKGDFLFLPELYVKAFIKDYAKFVGIDENETIKKYEAAKKGIDYNKNKDETESEIVQTEKKEKPDVKEKLFGGQQNNTIQNNQFSTGFNLFSDKKNIKILAIVGGVILLIIIALLIFNSNNQPEIIIKEKPYEEIRKENQQRFVEDKTNIKIKKEDSLELIISATDTSWIKVKSNTSGPKEFILFPGSKININSNEKFVMIIGNSGGITLNLNGNELNISGKDKLVKYLIITKKGINFLKTEPTFTNN